MHIPGTVNHGFPPVVEYFHVVTVLAIFLLAAKMKASGAVIVFIRYGKMVVNMAKNRFGSYLPATSAECAYRKFSTNGPAPHVDAGNGWFHDMVSGQPRIIGPVSRGVLHIIPATFPRKQPQGTSMERIIN